MLTRTDVLRAYQILHDDMLLAAWDDHRCTRTIMTNEGSRRS